MLNKDYAEYWHYFISFSYNNFFAGRPNLQLHVNLDFTGTTWDERLLDHETDAFEEWNQQLTNYVRKNKLNSLKN